MSNTQQPDALRLAHTLSGGKLIDDSTEWADTLHAAAAELRHQHTRIEELEAQLAATQSAAQGLEADLTDEQIDEAFNQMPDGAAGFLKSWGYRQFARAVLAVQAKQKD